MHWNDWHMIMFSHVNLMDLMSIMVFDFLSASMHNFYQNFISTCGYRQNKHSFRHFKRTDRHGISRLSRWKTNLLTVVTRTQNLGKCLLWNTRLSSLLSQTEPDCLYVSPMHHELWGFGPLCSRLAAAPIDNRSLWRNSNKVHLNASAERLRQPFESSRTCVSNHALVGSIVFILRWTEKWKTGTV